MYTHTQIWATTSRASCSCLRDAAEAWYPTAYLSIYLSIYLYLYLYLSSYRPVSIYIYIYPSIYSSITVYLFIYLSIYGRRPRGPPAAARGLRPRPGTPLPSPRATLRRGGRWSRRCSWSRW